MQTEQSQPEGKRIMPETRFTKFPTLSVHLRAGISRCESETDDWLFFLPIIGSFHNSFVYYLLKPYMKANS